MTCHNCKIETKKDGKDRKGNQRFRCNQCKRRFQEEREKLLGNMYLSEEKSLLVLRLLLEGNSIRSIERITGVEKKTITRILLNAGEHCEQLMNRKIKGVAPLNAKNVPRVACKASYHAKNSKNGKQDHSRQETPRKLWLGFCPRRLFPS